jgi:hypothetical protein
MTPCKPIANLDTTPFQWLIDGRQLPPSRKSAMGNTKMSESFRLGAKGKRAFLRATI